MHRLEGPAEAEEQVFVLDKIMHQVVEISKDVYGYKLVVHFLDKGSKGQQRQVIDELHGHFLDISFNKQGCWVAQKALEVASPDLGAELADELSLNVQHCIKDLSANYVVQKIIEVLPQQTWSFVLEEVKCHKTFQLSCHKCGCRIVMRLLEHATPASKSSILDNICETDNIRKMSNDKFGNFVVQSILENGRIQDIKLIMQVAKDDILSLNLDQYSSYVFDKCFKQSASGEHKASLVHDRRELMHSLFDPVIGQALQRDRFGAIVINLCLQQATRQEKLELQQLKPRGPTHQ